MHDTMPPLEPHSSMVFRHNCVIYIMSSTICHHYAPLFCKKYLDSPTDPHLIMCPHIRDRGIFPEAELEPWTYNCMGGGGGGGGGLAHCKMLLAAMLKAGCVKGCDHQYFSPSSTFGSTHGLKYTLSYLVCT